MIPSVMAQAGGANEIFGFLVPLVLIFTIFYFLLIRPQQKRAADHRKMVEGVRRGDTVVTAGGMIGKVTRVLEGTDEVMVEIAENVRVRVVRGTLMDVRSKGEPVPAKESDKSSGA